MDAETEAAAKINIKREITLDGEGQVEIAAKWHQVFTLATSDSVDKSLRTHRKGKVVKYTKCRALSDKKKVQATDEQAAEENGKRNGEDSTAEEEEEIAVNVGREVAKTMKEASGRLSSSDDRETPGENSPSPTLVSTKTSILYMVKVFSLFSQLYG